MASPSGGSSSPHGEELVAAATERDNLATSVKVQARVLTLSRPRLTPHHHQQESETLSHLGFGSPSRNVRHDRFTAYLYGVRGSNHPFICSDRLIDTHIAHSSSLYSTIMSPLARLAKIVSLDAVLRSDCVVLLETVLTTSTYSM